MPETFLILRAIDFAADRHKLQRRKGAESIPYINHPIKVATLIKQFVPNVQSNTLVAAILHDIIEDTETTEEEIAQFFGKEVASIVAEVSDSPEMTKDERKQHQIDTAKDLTETAKIIRLADKICNVKDICSEYAPLWDYKRKIDYLNWAEEVVEQIKGIHEDLEFMFKDEVKWGRLKLT